MKKLFAILIGLMGTLAAWAQTSIRVEVHNIVELSERFNLVFVVEGEQAPSDFQWTAGEDVTVVWGPQKGSSRNVQIVNGKTTRSSQTFYTYILQARKTGTLTIPSAVAKVKGEELRSKPVTIQVVDDGGSSAAGSTASQEPSQAGGQQQARQATSNQGDIFLRLSLSRTSVVVGEPITATLKIYNRTNLVDFENARFPTFNGFWSQEVDSPTNIEFKREQVDGTMYNSAILRRWVIIPQKAGDQTIDPAEIVCLVNVQQRRSTGSIFDDFFNSDFVRIRFLVGPF